MANKIFVKLSQKYGNNEPFPEGRLPPAMLAAVLVPGSMFWFAWTGFTHVHWAVPVASGIPFGWCMVMLFVSSCFFTRNTPLACPTNYKNRFHSPHTPPTRSRISQRRSALLILFLDVCLL